jgi:hypothetical protein
MRFLSQISILNKTRILQFQVQQERYLRLNPTKLSNNSNNKNNKGDSSSSSSSDDEPVQKTKKRIIPIKTRFIELNEKTRPTYNAPKQQQPWSKPQTPLQQKTNLKSFKPEQTEQLKPQKRVVPDSTKRKNPDEDIQTSARNLMKMVEKVQTNTKIEKDLVDKYTSVKEKPKEEKKQEPKKELKKDNSRDIE